jgi:filamentous hemagglutinin
MTSGGDTTLRGATVTAPEVIADVGGNLQIESLQDTSTYQAKQSSSGVGVSLCIPPFCYGVSTVSGGVGKAKVNGDFASVTEQSAIRAGDGGFQVDVKGSTDLKGGAITSSQAAVDAGLNTFASVGPVTSSDIQNRDNYSASGYGVSGGFGSQLGDQSSAQAQQNMVNQGLSKQQIDYIGKYDTGTFGPQGSAGFGQASGSQGSVTKSGISGVAAAGDSSIRTGDQSAALTQNWNGQQLMDDVQAQVVITAQFGQLAIPIAAKTADDKAIEMRRQNNEEEALKWDEGGVYRTALYTAIGGLTGGLAGAAGSATNATLIPQLGEQIAGLNLPAPVRDALTLTASAVIGAAAGGAAGVSTAIPQTVYNYISHSPFASVRRTVSQENARLMNACGANCTLEEMRAIDLQVQKLESAGNLAAISQTSKLTTEQAEQFAQLAMELMPITGTTESFVQLMTGKQSLTGEEVGRFWAAVGLVPVAGGMLQRIGSTTADVLKAMQAIDKVADASKQQGLINEANKLFKQYIDDIETQTGYRLSQAQRTALADEMRVGDHAITLTPVETASLRAEFSTQRSTLISEWEKQTGQSWPKVEVVKNGRTEVQNAQAHHIIPCEK